MYSHALRNGVLDSSLVLVFKDFDNTINENLMAALTNNLPHFVQLFLDHGAAVRWVRNSCCLIGD